MLGEEGQKIIASFGRVPTRRGIPTTAQGIDKLNYVIDDIGAGEDFNRYNELFREYFRRAKILERTNYETQTDQVAQQRKDRRQLLRRLRSL